MSRPDVKIVAFQDGAELRVFVGGTLESAEDLARTAAEKVLRTGRPITWSDSKTREWINTEPDWVLGRGPDGEKDYVPVFDKSGNRVRCSRTRVVVLVDGTRTETKLRPVWRSYEEAME